MPRWILFETADRIDFAYMAQPFFSIVANADLDELTLDFAYMARPFLPYGVTRR